MIIAGFAGVGKTTCAKMLPEETIDFLTAPYRYETVYGAANDESLETPLEKTEHPNWPFNYVDALQSIKDDYRYVLIPADTLILSLLKDRGISFIVVRPFRMSKDEYRRRFIERGGINPYTDTLIEQWDSYMDSLERVGSGVHVTLDIDEYLSDVIKKFDHVAASLMNTSIEMMLACGAIVISKEEGVTQIDLKSEIFKEEPASEK